MGILKILGTSNPMVPRSHGNLYKPSIHKPNLSGFPKYPRWSISPDSLCSSDHKHGQGAKLTTRWPAKRGPKLEAGKCWANPQTLHSCSKRKPENPRAGVFFFALAKSQMKILHFSPTVQPPSRRSPFRDDRWMLEVETRRATTATTPQKKKTRSVENRTEKQRHEQTSKLAGK